LNLIRVMPAKGQDMPTSIFLAKLIGPILVIVGVGMLVNRKTFRAFIQEMLRSPALIVLFGLVDLTGGLAIVLTHNVWVMSWRVIITLIGWLMVIRGTARILVPDQLMGFGAKIVKRDEVMIGSLAAAVVLGLVLSYFGYAQ
jgi:hypothetical protein